EARVRQLCVCAEAGCVAVVRAGSGCRARLDTAPTPDVVVEPGRRNDVLLGQDADGRDVVPERALDRAESAVEKRDGECGIVQVVLGDGTGNVHVEDRKSVV